MALTIGTNCGFVTTAPSADPTASNTTIDDLSLTGGFMSPSNIYRIIEMGWWCDEATEESNFEVGLYEAMPRTSENRPGGLVEVSRTNAKGTTSGWKSVTGLNWIVTPNTFYNFGLQLDNTATTTSVNIATSGGLGYDKSASTVTTLPSPYSGGPLLDADGIAGIYAKYETIPAGVPYALSGCWSLSGSTANSGSLTIPVPSGATLALVGVTGYKNESRYFSSGSVTLGGSAMSVAYQADSDTTKYQGALFYLQNPSSGSQTLAYDWYGSNAPSNFPVFAACFYANTHATTPIRSSGGQQVTIGTATTGSMTAQTNDMAVAFGFGYANSPTNDSMQFTSGSEVFEDSSGKSVVGWCHSYPTGDITITRTDVGPLDDGGICGVVLMPAAASTLSGSQINIGDSWRAISSSQINIGDVWKTVSVMKINIGDTWKTITI